MTVTVSLAAGVDLVLADAVAARVADQLAQQVVDATVTAVLDDDHPLWERHSGGSGHDGTEWTAGDEDLAEAFYRRIKGKAKLFFDLLLDHPGTQLTVDGLIEASEGEFTSSFSVAGAINGLRLPHTASGRRYPFYWWEGTPTRYAVKPSVAAVFNAARAKAVG